MQNWKPVPFKVLETAAPGLLGGIAAAANPLGLTQSATYNVVRALSVSHSLNLRQSDYWIESPSHLLGLSHEATEIRDIFNVASNSLTLTDYAHAEGGHIDKSIREIVGGGVILAGQAIYIKSDGLAYVAEADVAATWDVVGVAVAAGGGIVSGPLFYQTYGHLRLDTWNWLTGSATLTSGAIYYLTTDAKLSTTPPIGNGHIVIKIGSALDEYTLNIEIGEGVLL